MFNIDLKGVDMSAKTSQKLFNSLFKISGFITRINYMDGNFVIFDKLSKSLAIYYLNIYNMAFLFLQFLFLHH